MGDAEPGTLLRRLRSVVLAGPRPDPRALAQGLELLERTDLRDALGEIAVPALVISGGNDRLTPPEAGRRLAEALPRGRFALVAGAAHAPFLSRPAEFLDHLGGFLNETGA
jgi:pimeloyl-[acyl-carrier protein] methyl ester esterase